jgi:hypothetical protein
MKTRFQYRLLPAGFRIGMMLKLVVFFLFFVACQKEMTAPVTTNNAAAVPAEVKNFRINKTNLVLLEGNADAAAVNMTWDAVNVPGVTYIVEAGAAGTGFEQKVEMGATDLAGLTLTVREMNQYLCQLVYVNNTARVEFRVRAQFPGVKAGDAFATPVAADVTTYRPFIEYNAPRMFRVPGTFQNWKVNTAPKIVDAAQNGVYEGYLNFDIPYTQFLLVKGEEWMNNNTYYNIGNNKFGFGGAIMAVYGQGTYRLTANTNTNTWNYTKINNWAIAGNAVGAETDMKPGTDPLTWVITVNMNAGTFRFRANHTDAITMGQEAGAINGLPAYDGKDIVIRKAGVYTVTLDLRNAGNYAYTVQTAPGQ